ncbi:hypothetical protein [Phaeobacter italicus]|jgi:hypothetical protein|uniref:hypothetical protein n=1 Tax=Phaeobacter italicus TaxID=481446 RepID=UPI002FDD6481
MTNEQIATVAAKHIANYRNDPIIMEFVTNEAREKVAELIREEMGGQTTAKAVEILEMRYPNIAKRVEEYIGLGLIGCFMASLEA